MAITIIGRRAAPSLRPSALRVRVARSVLLEGSKSVDTSLKGIRNELGIKKLDNSNTPTSGMDHSPKIGDRLESSLVDLKNTLHRDIWNCIKRNDRRSFEELSRRISSSNIRLDGVSYTLLVHGTLLFSQGVGNCTTLLREMEHAGIHPSLIRFNAVCSSVDPRLLTRYRELLLHVKRWVPCCRSLLEAT